VLIVQLYQRGLQFLQPDDGAAEDSETKTRAKRNVDSSAVKDVAGDNPEESTISSIGICRVLFCIC